MEKSMNEAVKANSELYKKAKILANHLSSISEIEYDYGSIFIEAEHGWEVHSIIARKRVYNTAFPRQIVESDDVIQPISFSSGMQLLKDRVIIMEQDIEDYDIAMKQHVKDAKKFIEEGSGVE